MVTLKNLTRYIPEYIGIMVDALYLQTEDGLDWYCHLSRFNPEAMKICFDEQGIIRSLSIDATRLCPMNLSVTEIEISDIPDGFSANGGWLWDGEKVSAIDTVRDEQG